MAAHPTSLGRCAGGGKRGWFDLQVELESSYIRRRLSWIEVYTLLQVCCGLDHVEAGQVMDRLERSRAFYVHHLRQIAAAKLVAN